MKAINDAIREKEYFNNGNNTYKLWVPTDRQAENELELPPMLLLPMIIAEWLAEEPRMPYDLRMKLTEYVTQNQQGVTSNDVKLLKEWCIVAAQGKDDKASLLALALDPVEEDTAHFDDWADTRLNGTLGPTHGWSARKRLLP